MEWVATSSVILCGSVSLYYLNMEEQSWVQLEAIDSSNCEQLDQQEQTCLKGVSSIIKNQTLTALLARPPFARTEKECRAIADLLKLEPYFETFAKNYKALLEVSSWIEVRQATPGEYIYRVHDLADSFYIILTGEVHLTYPEKEVLELDVDSLEQNAPGSTNNLKESAFYPTAVPALAKNHSFNPLHPHPQQETPKPKRLTRHESLYTGGAMQVQAPSAKKALFEERIVQVVGRRESFGDLGESQRRGTNAVAKEACQLLLVKKQHYGTLSSAHVKSQSKQKFELLSSVPLFKLLYRYALESLIYLMEEQRLAYNSVLYSEDDPARYVYVIFRGEFKLYKRVACGKDAASSSQDVQERARRTNRNVSLKTIGLGEVLGCWEAYERTGAHQETCVCKSQDGLVLRIEKAKFLKKVLSPENNLEEIVPFLEQKGAQRRQEVREFLQKYESNNLFVRYLHTPSAKSRRVNTESAVYRQRSERAEELRKLSSASNNFFNEFNKTVKQEVRSTRISVKKSIRFNESREPVPSRIKDIIGIVDQEANYYKIRKPKENITLFDFNIGKVPIHVKKKYDLLFKKQNQ